MPNLTIRMDPDEKRQLGAWAATNGKTVSGYVKDLIAADMASGSPESRAKAWLKEHADAVAEEARRIGSAGIPGADIALHYPAFDEDL